MTTETPEPAPTHLLAEILAELRQLNEQIGWANKRLTERDVSKRRASMFARP